MTLAVRSKSDRLPMPKTRAIVLAKEIAAARRKWGKQANPPYSLHQIMDAIVTLEAEGAFEPTPVDAGAVATTPEEVTKLRRQLAVCLNREKARKEGRKESTDDMQQFGTDGEEH